MHSTFNPEPKLVRMQAFPLMHESHTQHYQVWGGAELTASALRVRFKIEASDSREFAKIVLPEVNSHPDRRDELWKETCFECFIPSRRSDAYLEWNGSPSGDWNAYSFHRYREGMNAFDLSFEGQSRQTTLICSEKQIESEWVIPLLAIRIGGMSAGDTQFDFNRVGLTLVLNTSVATTYWALSHEGVKPDFHLSSSFTYSLPTGA